MSDPNTAPDFSVRAFEFCDNNREQTGMWRWRALERSLDLMERGGFNTMIFHQNDLTDWAVLPRAYFSPEVMHERWPVRLMNVENGKSHLREVVRQAKQKGIRFFLEVKEMSFPEELLELHPEVMEIKGVPCPTHPFWWDFEREKYRELLEDIPDIAGVIVSAGTRESKLSLAVHACTCERCRTYSSSDWYANIVRALYEPLQAKGKQLVVRDFAYSRDEQNLVVDACSRVSNEIIVALKNTAHDFYPPFPDNPRIGHAGAHPQWIEFDVWCQFSGMGFFPVSYVEDIQRRLRYAKQNGAVGAMFRMELELVSDASCFNSFDLVNLFAAGMLTQRFERNLDEVYDAWLEYGIADHLKSESEQAPPVPVSRADRPRFREFMRASWRVMEKAVYVRGHVFTDGTCQFPFSVEHAFFDMLVYQGRDDWEPGASKRIAPTAENLRIVLEEKAQAEREVAALPSILQLETLELPPEIKQSIATLLDLYQWFVRGMARATAAAFTAKRAMTTKDAGDVAAGKAAAEALAEYRAGLGERLRDTDYPHYVYWFFDFEFLDRLTADARAKMAALS